MKEDVLQQLLGLSSKELCSILHEVADKRPELKLSFLEAGQDPASSEADGWHNHQYASRLLRSISRRDEGLDLPIGATDSLEPVTRSGNSSGYALLKLRKSTHAAFVQFAATEVFCVSSDKTVDVEVNRSGATDEESSVDYFTKDISEGASACYVQRKGTLVIPPGASSAKITFEMKAPSTIWKGLDEFQVHLDPNSCQGCELGHQLKFTRVKVLQTVLFPSSKYEEALRGGMKDKIFEIHWSFLLYDYYCMVLSSSTVRINTIKGFLVDCLNCIIFLSLLLAQLYLIDDILQADRGVFFCRPSLLLCIAGLQCFCAFIAHMSSLVKVGWGVTVPTVKVLLQGILMSYLNFDLSLKSAVNDEGLLLIVFARDSFDCANLYSKFLELIKEILDVFALLSFKIVAPIVAGRPVFWLSFLPFVFFPIVLGLFLRCRQGLDAAALTEHRKALDDITSFGNDCLMHRSIIRDYRLRRHCVECLDEYLTHFKVSNIRLLTVNVNSSRFMTWMTAMLMGYWIIYGGTLVLNGSITLGIFVTNLRIYAQVGQAVAQAYAVLLDLQVKAPALVRVCSVMNAPTDLETRLQNYRMNAQETARRRNAAARIHPINTLNHVNIVVKDIMFQYAQEHRDRSINFSNSMSFEGRFEIQQSTLVGLTGVEGHGKSALLNLIGGAHLPTLSKGKIFIPVHLRVLNVLSEPMFFQGSMIYNLTVGCNTEADGDPERVLKILNALSLPADEILASEALWKAVVTMTQVHKLNIARALIANPHLLCIHKPTLAFDEEMSRAVIQLLKNFVTERGIYTDMDKFDTRRPRTCVFTSSKVVATEYADHLYRVVDGGIEQEW